MIHTKPIFVLATALILCACCASNQNATNRLNKDTAAPDFEAKDKDDNALKLSGLVKDGPVVLSFLRSFS